MNEIITPEGSEAELREARKSGSLTTMVREHLEQMILSGRLKAGERLGENTLATELKVSRGPIREATRLLAEAGLVTIIKNRGVFVREVSLEEVLHLYDVRAGLARVAGRLAAMRATPAQIDELKALWEQMEEDRQARSSESYHELNDRFHRLLLEATANPRLIVFHQMTRRELHLFTRRGVSGPRHLDRSNREHRQILDCIINGDELGAAEAFEAHILKGRQRMLDSLGS